MSGILEIKQYRNTDSVKFSVFNKGNRYKSNQLKLMKYTKYRLEFWVCLFLMIPGILIQAQVQTEEAPPPWNTGTIKTQFDYMILKSTPNADFRMVKQNWLYIVKSRVLDTIKLERKQNLDNITQINLKSKEVDSLQSLVTILNKDLSKVTKEKESISWIGISMSKHYYQMLVWALIGILVLTLLILFMLYQRSHFVTVQTKTSHKELQEEYDAFRKRALKREEELSRQHLTELNKYRNKGGML